MERSELGGTLEIGRLMLLFASEASAALMAGVASAGMLMTGCHVSPAIRSRADLGRLCCESAAHWLNEHAHVTETCSPLSAVLPEARVSAAVRLPAA